MKRNLLTILIIITGCSFLINMTSANTSEKVQTAQKFKEVKRLVEEKQNTHDLPLNEIMPKVKEAETYFRNNEYRKAQDILDGLIKGLNAIEKTGRRAGISESRMDVTKINTSGWQDTPFISGDGRKLFFTYSPHDFLLARKTKFSKIEVKGPIRPGHFSDEYTTKPQVLVVHNFYAERKTGSGWGEPKPLHFEGGDRVGGSMWVNESGDTMYLAGWDSGERTNYGSGDIYMSTKKRDNLWTKPVNLGHAINTKYLEDNPHVSTDGSVLFFDSDRPGGHGMWDIYYSVKDVKGEWTKPVNLGPPINTGAVEGMGFFINGRLYFVRGDPAKFAPTQLYVSEKSQDGQWSEPILIDLGMTGLSSPSLTKDEKELYFLMENDGRKELTIWFSQKKPDGTWIAPKPVD